MKNDSPLLPPPLPDKTHPLLVLEANLWNETIVTERGRKARAATFELADCYARGYATVGINSNSPFFDVLVDAWKERRHVRVDGDFVASSSSRLDQIEEIRSIEPLTDEEEKDWQKIKERVFEFQYRIDVGRVGNDAITDEEAAEADEELYAQ